MTSARARIAALFLSLCFVSVASADATSAQAAKSNALDAKSSASSKKSAAQTSETNAANANNSLPMPKSWWTQAQIDQYCSYIDTGHLCAQDGSDCISSGNSWFNSANGNITDGDSDFFLQWYVSAENKYNIAKKQYATNHIDTPGNDDAWLLYDEANGHFISAYNWYYTAMMYWYSN